MPPRASRWHLRARHRSAVVVVVGAVVGALCSAVLWPAVGLGAPGSAKPAGQAEDEEEEEAGYVEGPSYLDPILDPFVVPELVETISVPPIEVISRRSDVPGDVLGGWEPSMSANGRYVVFTSYVAGSTSQTTVHMRDRATGELLELTPTLPEFATRSSRGGVISADGCAVAVLTTSPYDVFRDSDTGSRWDVYRQQLPQCAENPDEGGGEWELMSTATSGDDGALNTVDPESRLALSGAGTVVAFRSVAAERFGSSAPVGEILVADATVTLGSTSRVRAVPGLPSSPADGQFFVSGHSAPVVSADGRFVVFVSDARADAAEPVWAGGVTPAGPATAQVYVWDGLGGRPRLVSADGAGEPLRNGARQPTLSPDGRVVYFVANAVLDANGRLDGACDRCPANVFADDRDANGDGVLDEAGATAIRAVSAVDGSLGDGDSAAPTVALGGRLVGYVTKAPNLAPGAIGTAGTFVVTDTGTGRTTVGSLESGGQRPAAVVSGWPSMSENGRNVAVETSSPDVLGAAVVGTVGTQAVAITATPAVRLSDIDVGTTFVNLQSAGTVTLTNGGPGAFVPATISSTSTDLAVSGGTCVVSVPVAAGDSCTLTVVFTVTSLGASSAQLIVSERGIGAVSVAATVTGSGGVPKLTTEPPTVTFADALVGVGGETLSVVIRNVGVGPMGMSTAVLGGTHPGDYKVVADACTNARVPEQGACVVRVGFAPTSSGARTAVVILTAVDGSIARATLSGRGFFSPKLTITPRAVEAGATLRVEGSGFPADVDVVIAWEGAKGRTLRADATGAFTLRLGTSDIAAGGRRLRVADSVPPGATPRYEAFSSDVVQIAETVDGLDATSPVFDDIPA